VHMRTYTKFVSIAVCLAFVLAACGSDSKSTTTDEETTVSVADTSATETSDPAATDSSVDDSDTSVDNSGDDDAVTLKDEEGFLVDDAGMTLYIFSNDPPDTSTCSGGCAETWPPLLVGDSGFTAHGNLETTDYNLSTRDDGTTQVTYQGQPLYYYAGDSSPGDRNGDGIGGVWFAVEF